MKKILQQLKDLEKISNQLELSADERKKSLTTIEKFSSNFIDKLPEVRSFSESKLPSSLLKITQNKKALDELLQLYQSEVVEKGIIAASGGHLGYIPGGGIFNAAIADFIAAVTNPYAGIFYASPGAVTIENEVIDWLKKMFSFPKSAVGNLASGGSISNLIALTAARDKHKIKIEKIPKSVIYLSQQVHHCIQKSLRIIGLEDAIIRYVELDEAHKMKPSILNQLIENDLKNNLTPFLVVASAGTTDTGAIDPLNEIATISKNHNLWLHVDAAYGGFFILTSKRHLFKGIEKADSLVIDPHKGLFLPYGLGAVLIKDKKAAFHSNHYLANYMQDAQNDDLSASPANVSPELTKHFRGFRLWLPLQLHGIKPFIACLEEKLLLTTYFREKLVELGFKVGPTPDLSVSYFWYPFNKNTNALNKKLIDAIHKDGSVFLSSSIINEQVVLRMAILSFRTKISTINRALEMLSTCLADVKLSVVKK